MPSPSTCWPPERSPSARRRWCLQQLALTFQALRFHQASQGLCYFAPGLQTPQQVTPSVPELRILLALQALTARFKSCRSSLRVVWSSLLGALHISPFNLQAATKPTKSVGLASPRLTRSHGTALSNRTGMRLNFAPAGQAFKPPVALDTHHAVVDVVAGGPWRVGRSLMDKEPAARPTDTNAKRTQEGKDRKSSTRQLFSCRVEPPNLPPKVLKMPAKTCQATRCHRLGRTDRVLKLSTTCLASRYWPEARQPASCAGCGTSLLMACFSAAFPPLAFSAAWASLASLSNSARSLAFSSCRSFCKRSLSSCNSACQGLATKWRVGLCLQISSLLSESLCFQLLLSLMHPTSLRRMPQRQKTQSSKQRPQSCMTRQPLNSRHCLLRRLS